MNKLNLPNHQPLQVTVVNHDAKKGEIKAKFVPRAPKDGEVMVLIGRPQAGPHSFQEYAKGDVLRGGAACDVEEIQRGWVTDAVYDLACEIITTRKNDLMPILADALVDAGCQNETILDSLREKKSEGWVSKILRSKRPDYVVVLVKGGYTRGGEGWKRWEQLAIVRRATAKEMEAVAGQQAEQDADARRVMDRMMSS